MIIKKILILNHTINLNIELCLTNYSKEKNRKRNKKKEKGKYTNLTVSESTIDANQRAMMATKLGRSVVTWPESNGFRNERN